MSEWPESRMLPYQRAGVEFILKHNNCMLWEDPGLGKTIQSLTAIVRLRDTLQTPGVLVLAPKRIIELVWRQEAEKWDHTRHLTFSLVLGSARERTLALMRPADVHLCNYDNIKWLVSEVERRWHKKKKYQPFQMVIFDEITKMKNATSIRTKEWTKKLSRYFSRRVGLTGEPAANGYVDLFGQYLCVDGGQRLGSSIEAYRTAFLKPKGYNQFGWEVTKTGKDRILRRISDITLNLSAEELLDLPPVKYNIIWVDLPRDARVPYDKMERDFFASLEDGAEIEAPNEGTKLNKLIQIATGAVYQYVGGPWSELHHAKLDALEDLVEESSGRPLLLGYQYRHEAERIARTFPADEEKGSGAFFLSSKLGEREIQKNISLFKQDRMQLLCGHPDSIGHGLNLQGGSARSVVWTCLPWALDLFNQLNARLIGGHRRTGASVVHMILARDTIDELLWEINLSGKIKTQQDLRSSLQKYKERREL